MPASRHMSTWRRAASTSVLPTLAKFPRPPKVIVPSDSADTRRPDRPSWRYSMLPPVRRARAPAGDRCRSRRDYPTATGAGGLPPRPRSVGTSGHDEEGDGHAEGGVLADAAVQGVRPRGQVRLQVDDAA